MSYQLALPSTTNAEDFAFSIKLIDKRSGLPLTETDGLTADVEIRPAPRNGCRRDDYGFWDCCGAPVLNTSSLEGGAITIDGNVISGVWRADKMSSLCAGLYAMGMILKQDGTTVQLFIGTFPVREGFPK